MDLFAVQGTLKSLLQHHSSKVSILQRSAFFIVQLSHPFMTTGKTIALTRRTFVGKVMSLLFNMLFLKKDLHDPDNHDGVISHLEPDILKCKVKWALGSITTNKASGSYRTPIEVFQITKDDAVKVLQSICQQIWKTQQWPQDWKRSVTFQSQRKAMPKNAKTTSQLHSSHMLVMLKIL